MLKIRNINKSFKSGDKRVHALKDVSLDINAHSITGIAGLSGAGKSTLLRCINLLETVDSGSIEFKGEDITRCDKKTTQDLRTQMGMVFQHFNLMSQRTVAENVALPLSRSSLSHKEKEQRVKAMLERVGIKSKIDNYPHQLSGGEKQRVAIARALITNPEILLCDEATSALDPQTTVSILALLKQLNEELGITIILITHQMEVIKAICEDVVLMDHGQVVEKGAIVDIFSNPQSQLAKGFVDTVNYREGLDFLHQNNKLQINENERLYELVYLDRSSQQSIISDTIKKFDVVINILFGNIELIHQETIGKLIIKISGSKEAIEAATKYIIENNVTLKEIDIHD